MEYGIQNEGVAVNKYIEKAKANGDTITVEECGLIVDTDCGQLAASPDRLATFNQVKVVVEVKCLSASTDFSPTEAVQKRQKDSSFAFNIENSCIALKKKHQYYTQVQMQMAITKRNICHLIIFTSELFDIHICKIAFDEQFWSTTKEKLLNFHNTYVVPALVKMKF